MRNTTSTTIFALALSTASVAVCAATAQVEFVNPDKFTDAGRKYVGGERDDNLKRLGDHFVEQAAKRLPADQKLTIWVTDVDIAGYYDPRQKFADEARIVKDIYPPKLAMRFKLARADGTVVKEGERKLSDRNFLTREGRYDTDGLGYEKMMIDDWFRREFKAPKAK
jgi:hypothetical protein